MKLVVEDGVLVSCRLEAQDRGVVDLEYRRDITSIADNAFASIPAGTLRRLCLPQTLSFWQERAFAGVGALDVLRCPSLSEDQWAEFADRGNLDDGLMNVRHLVIEPDGGGVVLLLYLMGILPEKITMPADVDIYEGWRDHDNREFGMPGVRELNLVVWGDVMPRSGTFGWSMSEGLVVLRVMNRYACDEGDACRWDLYNRAADVSGTRHPSLPVGSGTSELPRWRPCCSSGAQLGVDTMEALETLVLPEGMAAIPDGAFADCPNLRAVRIPSSVRRIGKGAFRDCARLRSVSIDSASDTLVDIGAFSRCSKLRSVGLRETLPTGRQRVAWKVPTRTWRAQRQAALVTTLLTERYPELADLADVIRRVPNAGMGQEGGVDEVLLLRRLLRHWQDSAQGRLGGSLGETSLPDDSDARLARELTSLFLDAAQS